MNILTATADGSNTFFNEEIGEHYHSSHGAVQESKHVFIEAGLKHALANFPGKEIRVLEVGFGTGLNFLLSFEHCEVHNINLNYTGIEAFPLAADLLKATDYQQFVDEAQWNALIANYNESFSRPTELTDNCTLSIVHTTLQNFDVNSKFDLLYYDAFSVRHQPELWTDEMIAHACNYIAPGGIFVTYAITGNLKRALKKCGLKIEKLPGAPGKREMLRATKVV